MEEVEIKRISGWQNYEYVIVGYVNIKDIEEFISINVSALNREGNMAVIINLNKDSFYSSADSKKTIVLHNCNSIIDLRINARLLVREHDIQIFFLDNLTLLNYQNLYVNSSSGVSKMISRSLRSLSRELKLPIVSFLPANPTGKEINCIGELQFDADIVIFLTRNEKNRLKLMVAKNRNGSISEI